MNDKNKKLENLPETNLFKLGPISVPMIQPLNWTEISSNIELIKVLEYLESMKTWVDIFTLADNGSDTVPDTI